MKRVRVLLICSLFGCGTAFGDGIFDCNQSPFFVYSSITQVVDSACTNQSVSFTFETPLSATGIKSADYVYLDGSQPLTSPGDPGISFLSAADGLPGDPVTSGPIEIQFAVRANAGAIAGSQVDFGGENSTTMAGTEKFCVGALFSGSSYTDDGCVANGGTLYTTSLASGMSVSFSRPSRLVDVWEDITFGEGAGFGKIGQTFSAISSSPKPKSPDLCRLLQREVIACRGCSLPQSGAGTGQSSASAVALFLPPTLRGALLTPLSARSFPGCDIPDFTAAQ